MEKSFTTNNINRHFIIVLAAKEPINLTQPPSPPEFTNCDNTIVWKISRIYLKHLVWNFLRIHCVQIGKIKCLRHVFAQFLSYAMWCMLSSYVSIFRMLTGEVLMPLVRVNSTPTPVQSALFVKTQRGKQKISLFLQLKTTQAFALIIFFLSFWTVKTKST